MHSDNGAPMKSVTLLTKMYDLGVTPSRGRPRSATIIRTRVIVPDAEVLSAVAIRRLCQSGCGQEWVRDFMTWYNEEHRHSRIRFVTPNERHRGEDKALLAKRDAVSGGPSATSNQVEWQDARLDTDRCRDAES